LSRYLAATAILLVAAVAQSLLGQSLPGVGSRPDFLLIAVLAWATLSGPVEGAAVGFIGGLLLDSAVYVPFGLNAALLGLAGYGTGLGQANVSRGNLPFFVVLGAVASLLYHAGLFLGLQAYGIALPPIVDGFQIALRAAILNAVLLIPALLLCRRVRRMLTGWRQARI
jgi:rod shape-determining protein MreD